MHSVTTARRDDISGGRPIPCLPDPCTDFHCRPSFSHSNPTPRTPLYFVIRSRNLLPLTQSGLAISKLLPTAHARSETVRHRHVRPIIRPAGGRMHVFAGSHSCTTTRSSQRHFACERHTIKVMIESVDKSSDSAEHGLCQICCCEMTFVPR